MLQATYKTTEIQRIVSEIDYLTRKLNYDTTKRDKERKEQLKHLTKMFHHLRTSAAVACEKEYDGSADYWADFFQKVSEFFQEPGKIEKWGKCQNSRHPHKSNKLLTVVVVRQQYKPSETTQSKGSRSSGVDSSSPPTPPSENGKRPPELESGIVHGEPLRNETVGMDKRGHLVEVECVNTQGVEAAPPRYADSLRNDLVTASYDEQVCGTSVTSGATVKSEPANLLQSDCTMDTVNADTASQSEPAEDQGDDVDLVKGVAHLGLFGKSELEVGGVIGRHANENKLVQIEYGVSGAMQNCGTDANSHQVHLGVGNTTQGDAIQDECIQDEGVQNEPSRDKPHGNRLTESKPVDNGLAEEVSMTHNGHRDKTVEDMYNTNNTVQTTSSGSERMVHTAAGIIDIAEAEAPANEAIHMEYDISGVKLTDSKSSSRCPASVEPRETIPGCSVIKPRRLMVSVPLRKPINSNDGPHMLDLVGSAQTMTMDDFEIQSGPVTQSDAIYSVQSRTSEDFAHGSAIDDGSCAQSQPTAAASWQAEFVDESAARHSNRDFAEFGAVEDIVDREISQRESSNSSVPDRASRQLGLARHATAEVEPASTKLVGSDQPGELRITRHTMLSVIDPDLTTDHLATMHPMLSSGETSPISPRKESMSDGELESGFHAGFGLRLSSSVRPLEVFFWPSDEDRGPYVVVMFERQLGLSAAIIVMIGFSLYFAYLWWV